jgi:hypothetical protein
MGRQALRFRGTGGELTQSARPERDFLGKRPVFLCNVSFWSAVLKFLALVEV